MQVLQDSVRKAPIALLLLKLQNQEEHDSVPLLTSPIRLVLEPVLEPNLQVFRQRQRERQDGQDNSSKTISPNQEHHIYKSAQQGAKRIIKPSPRILKGTATKTKEGDQDLPIKVPIKGITAMKTNATHFCSQTSVRSKKTMQQ